MFFVPMTLEQDAGQVGRQVVDLCLDFDEEEGAL